MYTRRQLGTQLAVISALLATRTGQARAADQTLRVGSISGAETSSYTQVLLPFVQAAEKDSGGRLELALKPAGGYGKPTELLPMVEKGDLEMASSVQGYYPGRFPQSSVIELPLMFGDALSGTRALTTVFKEGLLDKDYASVKVLALYVVPPFSILTTGKKIASLRDLRGLRIRTPGPTVGLPLAKLGAIPLGIPASMIGDAIANGTVDAIAFSLDSTLSTMGAGGKLLVNQLSVAADLRFAGPAQMVLMNRAKWDALPADLQAVLDKCGAALAVDGARVRQDSEVAARQKFQADPRYTFLAYSEQLHDELQHAVAPAYDDWKADMTRRGIDGARLLGRTRELVQQYSVAAK
jgi:TRAP-type transport system periplasmic protein